MQETKENINDFLVTYFEKKYLANSKNKALPLTKAKTQALADFKQLGIPTQKTEDYKYNNISKLGKKAFVPFRYAKINEKLLPKEVKPNSIILQNGNFVKHNLTDDKLEVCDVNQADATYSSHLEKYVSTKKTFTDGFLALNYMFSHSGLFVYIPRNTHIPQPINIINYISTLKEEAFLNNQMLIVAEQGANVSFNLENNYAASTEEVLHNQLIDIHLQENTRLSLYAVQDYPASASEILNLSVTQQYDSHFYSHLSSLAAKIIRNNLHISQKGENCETELYGFYACDSHFQVDNFTIINHEKPHCQSTQHFKGLVAHRGDAVFCGRIHVYKDAQKIKAYQQNNNFLLSEKATINSKPQLIIEADDVKCSHGATVGQIDKNELLYLQTRGISKKLAEAMLLYAFVYEIINKIKEEDVKIQTDLLIKNKLKSMTR